MTHSAETTLQLPFEHLNLTQNPFGQLSLEERASLAVGDFEDWVSYLSKAGRMLEFVGPSGRGKTTRLLGIWQHFPANTFVRFRGESTVDLASKAPIFADDFQFIEKRQWELIEAERPSVCLTTHVSFEEQFEAIEYEVKSITVEEISIERLTKAFRKRIRAFRRNDGRIPKISKAAIQKLVSLYDDNVRAMEHHLYNIFQRLESADAVIQPRHLQDASKPPQEIISPESYARRPEFLQS